MAELDLHAINYDDRKHPTPQFRVAHFVATMDDYERFAVAFPLPISLPYVGHQDDSTRWTVVQHALLLRKFFQPKDEMRLGDVVRAVHACVVQDDYPQMEWDAWEKDAEAFETKTIFHFGSESFNESELLEHFLYGRYLHGDFGKWMRTEDTPGHASDYALWSATHARVQRVREVAEIIRAGVEYGAVVYERPEAN